MGRKIKILSVAGRSEDERLVYAGVYKFQNTHGLSLYDILLFFKENDMLVCWKSYVEECLFFGKRKDSISYEIISSVEDSDFLPKEEMHEFKSKIDILCNSQIQPSTAKP